MIVIEKPQGRSVLFNCDYCGSEHSEPLSLYKRTKRHFCKRHCYDRFKSELRPIEEHPLFGSGRAVWKDCANCGKRIRVGLSRQKYRRNYCSNTCEASMRSKLPSTEQNRYGTGVVSESEHALRKAVRSITNKAIQAGKLVRQTCFCGAFGEAHHSDYNKPLKVKWLCRQHHAELHRALYDKQQRGVEK